MKAQTRYSSFSILEEQETRSASAAIENNSFFIKQLNI
jgi:hypothetical protein